MIEEDPDTASLVEAQLRREQDEARLADAAAERSDADADPAEERAHARRSEKAAYLRSKLQERARSEDEQDRTK